MIKSLTGIFLLLVALSCATKKNKPVNNIVYLRSDTVNVVKLTDSIAIRESSCRGCAYEESTEFAISDSMNLVKLLKVVTTDNNPPGTDGGSLRKDILLFFTGTGKTAFRLYKFLEIPKTVEDSSEFTTYTIDIRN